MNYIELAIYGFLAFCLIFGVLFGIKRGFKRSLVRGIIIIGVFIACVFLTPVITENALSDPSFQSMNIEESIIEAVGGADSSIGGMLTDSPDIMAVVIKAPFMFVNLFVFVVLFYMLKLLSLVVYWLICLIIKNMENKKLKKETSDYVEKIDKAQKKGKAKKVKKLTADAQNNLKVNKMRFLGGLVGLVQAVVIFAAVMIPVNSTLVTVGTISSNVLDINNPDSASADTYEEREEVVDGATVKYLEMVVKFNNSPMSFINNVFGLTDYVADNIAYVKIGDEKIIFSEEVETLTKGLSAYLALDTENYLEDVDNLEKITNTLFDSKIFATIIDDVIDYIDDNVDTMITNPILKDIFLAVSEQSDTLASLKESFASVFETLRLTNEMGLTTDFSTDALLEKFEGLSLEDSEKLVNQMLSTPILQTSFEAVMPALYQPIYDGLGLDIDSTNQKPNVQDWEKEQENLSTLLGNLNALSKFGGTSEEVNDDFVTQVGDSFNTIKESELFAPAYDTITDFDEETNEYAIVETLKDKILAGDEDAENPEKVAETINDIRAMLANQTDAVKTSENPKDNVDWDKVDWNEFADDYYAHVNAK